MTNRSGDVVQHYGYTAFGHERYQHNTAAFDVTNRYTGQQLDDETGLYFYQSRYYDPELGRFTQADTLVPSADTSQALNRYAYVANNPLKFTDPSGHGWFSDLWDDIKGFIGTILTVALTPWLGPIAAIIGSAVGTIVNGGTFKSFAIGAAIGMAAGYIAGGMGFSPPDMFAAGFKFTTETILQGVVAGAVTGAVSGAISSAVYGGNWGKNMLEGAKAGAIGAGVAMATKAIGTWVQGMNATEEVVSKQLAYGPANPYSSNPLSGTSLAVGDPTFNQANPFCWANTPNYQLPNGDWIFAPFSVDIAANVEEARNMWPWEFYKAVKTGGKWDFKTIYHDLRYARFGNFHYGVVGKANGFPEIMLLNEGGRVNTSPFGAGKTGTPPFYFDGIIPYGDEWRDYRDINQGFEYYDNHFTIRGKFRSFL